MAASPRHSIRMLALLAIVVVTTLLPMAVVAADPSAAPPEADAGTTHAERMDEIVAKIRGTSRDGAAAGGSTATGMAALDEDDLAYLGLREGNGDCAGAYESATAAPGTACTHGLDVSADEAFTGLAAACYYVEDCPSPTGWDPATPPTKIPCYTTGPYVQVLYLYWGTGDFANEKERIRRSVASVDRLFKISASAVKNSSGTAGNRHVRWAMDSGCKLKITAVKMPTGSSDSLFPIRDNLVSRGIIKSSSKYLAYVDSGYCYGGVAQIAPNSSKAATNPSNTGGSLAMVYDCWDSFHPYAGFGATIAAHELMHTLGAVQYNAPHTTKGHCWDDLGEPHVGADIMCYDDYGVAASKFYERCTPTYPEVFDCGKDDYFNPYPSSGSYLSKYWNTAGNKFLSTAEPGTWETVPKPTVKFTKPATSGATIGGSTAAAIASSGVPGIPIDEVDWTINGVAVDNPGPPTTLQVPTFKTRSGGYANGSVLTIGAAVTDAGGLTGTGTTKATIWNPYVRVTSPSAFAETSGTAAWSIAAAAFGGRTVTKVDFIVDGVVKATDTTAPYGGTFTVPAYTSYGPDDNGPYTVAARVTDSAGVVRQSPQRTVYHPRMGITWDGPSISPAGYWTDSPLRVPAGRTVPMAVDAWSTATTGIHRVLFKVNGTTVATDYSAPYTYDHVTSSTVGTQVEVSARAVDAAGVYVTSETLYIASVANAGSQTATITPGSVDVGGDIAFRLQATPPGGGTIDSACLYIDNGYGDGCIYPEFESEDTITLPASTFGVGQHVAMWHLYITTAGGADSLYLDTGLARFTVTGSTGSPAVAVTSIAPGGRYSRKVTVGASLTGIPAGSVQWVSLRRRP